MKISSKIIITTLFLLFIIKINAQKSGIVIYKVINEVTNFNNKGAENNFSALDKKVYEIAKDFNFILKFNSKESLYFWEEEMPDENTNKYLLIMARVMGGGMTITYQNKIDSLILVQGHDPRTKEPYRETSSLYKYNWKITKEIDTILGYPVIKAVGKNVEVWFTPNIPVPFGPASYGGLPGLILKFKYKRRTIVAEKIRFLKKSIKIKKPETGTLRTEEEGRAARIKAMNFTK